MNQKLTDAIAALDRGDAAPIFRIAMGARAAATEGRYCECVEPEVTGTAGGVPDAEEVENEKWGRWSLLIMRVQAVVDQARMALDPEEFEPHGPLRALYFDRRHSLDLSPRSSAKERLA